MNNTIVLKFGGSSLADAGQFEKVKNIVEANPERKFVVVSAPGKRDKNDIKVTDMLYKCYDLAAAGLDPAPALRSVRDRYADIIHELGIEFDIDSEIEKLREELMKDPQKHFTASRGEYLSARVMAAYLNRPFVDAADIIFFKEDGHLDDEKTYGAIREKLKGMETGAVIPGFYGAMPDGSIHTFSRGGSDISGSIVACGVDARVYENWTDVSGMLAADPRIVDDPKGIEVITYRELRELSYMGASVLHEDAVFPAKLAGIPINIRNTNRPEDKGTMIVSTLPVWAKRRIVTGIAGKKGFSTIYISKGMLNDAVGFVANVLSIIADEGVSIEHCPTGIDTMSVIAGSEKLAGKEELILGRIRDRLQPDELECEGGLALIAVVGHGMSYAIGTAQRVFRAISEAGVNCRMIDQGSSELNIIVGVDEEDYEKAIRAIYKEFFE